VDFPDRNDGGSAIVTGSTIFGMAERDGRGDGAVLVRLSGEFDVSCQRVLEDTLGDCLASGRLTFVDLSGVTFMDSRCVRELAVLYRLGEGRMALCDPSWEVELSVVACDLEAWIDFVYTTSAIRRSTPRPASCTRRQRDGRKEPAHAHTIHGVR
jgi:anti-anti-sigma factor